MTVASRLTDVRREQIKHSEDLVLAEGALEGERLRAWMRLALAAALPVAVLTGVWLSGGAARADPWRGVAAGFYLLFAIAIVVLLRRVKPNVRGSTFGPIALTLTDFGFVGGMAARTSLVDGSSRGLLTVVACAIFLTFSATRISIFHVVLSTAAAVLTFLGVLAVSGTLTASSDTLGALVGFIALGTIIGFGNRQTRRMLVALRRRDNLVRLMPRQVAERILKEGGSRLEPVHREVTVLFVDVRDFTALSERLSPAQVLDFLNTVLGDLAQIVHGRDGVVNKYLGDGLLAVWGVPEPDERHAQNAVRAALDMLRAIEERSNASERSGGPAIRIGIGVHTGPVAAGMLGGPDQHEYTVIGDAVNLASRIEGLTKTHGAPLLVSEATWNKLGGAFLGTKVGEAQVKGREAKVTLYAIRDGGAQPASGAA